MSYYGPRNADLPHRDRRESERDWRIRARLTTERSGRVWTRSPSPSRKDKKNDDRRERERRRRREDSSDEEKERKRRRRAESSDEEEERRRERRGRRERRRRDDSSDEEEERRRERRGRRENSSDEEEERRERRERRRREDSSDEENDKQIENKKVLISEENKSHFNEENNEKLVENEEKQTEDDDSDEGIGPQLLITKAEQDAMASSTGSGYGDSLLPGEGEAIAEFVSRGLRIPRRGEIGWSQNEIESLETQGYVMSGSRHARMNAVRLRKENQVYSVEEKKALAILALTEKQQKEAEKIGEFKKLLADVQNNI